MVDTRDLNKLFDKLETHGVLCCRLDKQNGLHGRFLVNAAKKMPFSFDFAAASTQNRPWRRFYLSTWQFECTP